MDLMKKTAFFVATVVFVWWLQKPEPRQPYQISKYDDLQPTQVWAPQGDDTEPAGLKPVAQVHSEFQCDGRVYCSQMRSREEALYFVLHCPNTKMDGDGDGQPCENDSHW